MLKRLLLPLASLAFMTTILAAEAPQQDSPPEANDYTWTTDHMHVGVRWQPGGSTPQGNAYDATQPVISEDSGYVQFWVSWAAVEPTEGNQDYLKKPAAGLRCIEQCVDECTARGLKVEFVFFHAPAWATVEGKAGGFRAKDGLYGPFIERIARHFKGRVHAYQLAHEANLQALFEGADIDYVINELLIAGAKSVRKVYAEEPALPVIVSTSGGSPCHGCPTVEGLDAISGEGLHRFYDFLIASPELMNLVDALK